jgi:hypothetical protein
VPLVSDIVKPIGDFAHQTVRQEPVDSRTLGERDRRTHKRQGKERPLGRPGEPLERCRQ